MTERAQTDAEKQLVADLVNAWRGLHKGKPATRRLAVQVFAELGGHVYDGRTARLIPTQETHSDRRLEKSSKEYAIDMAAENDGVWVIAHRRPHGRWPRESRNLHPSGAISQRMSAAKR